MLVIKLTNKQLSVLRRILPTVKLNAYDIQVFQEIQQSIDNPIDYVIPSIPIKQSVVTHPVSQQTEPSKKFINTMKKELKNKTDTIDEIPTEPVKEENMFSVVNR